MKKWMTHIWAKAPHADGEMREFIGPVIEAPTAELASQWCQSNGLGYCYVGNECVAEIPFANGPVIDHETPTLN